MNRDYSFNKDVAILVGVENAVIIHSIMFWITKNKHNDKMFYDGRYWTYSSQKAMLKSFPFFSKDQIKRRISSLARQGYLIVTSEYSQDKKTYWYSVSNDITSIYERKNVIIDKKSINRDKKPKPTISKDEIIKVIEYFNLKAGKRYSTKNINILTEELISDRLKEGNTAEDLMRVISSKCKEWIGDSVMEKYLRPATLFNKEKFYTYLEEVSIEGTEKHPKVQEIIRKLTIDYGRRGIKNNDSDALARKLMELGYNNRDFLNMYLTNEI